MALINKSDNGPHSIGATMSFIVILIGFGLPVWWSTTTVQRASLPSNEIEMIPSYIGVEELPVRFIFKGPHNLLSKEKIQMIEHRLRTETSTNFKVVLQEMDADEVELFQGDLEINELENRLVRTKGKVEKSLESDVFIIVRPFGANLPDTSKALIGRHNHIFISEKTEVSVVSNAIKRMLPTQINFDAAKPHIPVATNYNVLLTLATSQENTTFLNLAPLVAKYLSSFSTKFVEVANLTISTQVVYVGNGLINADSDETNGRFIIDEDKVATLINALEPKLGSQLSVEPTFHWVLYDPHPAQSPMQIYKNGEPVATNSVLSPRWNGGGLQIANNNIDAPSCAGLVMSQLRLSFGLMQSNDMDSDVSVLSYDNSGIHDWELTYLIQLRTIQFLNQASGTLKSLNQLLLQIENIVVSDEIKDYIVTSVSMNYESRKALERNDLRTAYRSAKTSFENAEKAFFDPSLLALLYFPDDQKYAIYIPLFLPVGIPILLSLKSVFKHFR